MSRADTPGSVCNGSLDNECAPLEASGLFGVETLKEMREMVCVCVSIRLVGSEQTTQEQRKAQERSRGKTNIRTIEDGTIKNIRHKGRMCLCWMLALYMFLLRESVVLRQT